MVVAAEVTRRTPGPYLLDYPPRYLGGYERPVHFQNTLLGLSRSRVGFGKLRLRNQAISLLQQEAGEHPITPAP